MKPRTALILGATGLVGQHCLDLLLQEDGYDQIHTITRRAINKIHPKLQQHVIDFSDLAVCILQIKAQDIFCCLGSTLRQAGSKEAFRKVDYEYPVTAAQAGLRSGANQFLLVSAMGSDPRSILFYSRIKGETERAILALPYQSISIFRPSFLLGHRSETRFFESIGKAAMQLISPLLFSSLRKYRAIEASTVAWAMLKAAKKQRPDVHIFDSQQTEELGSNQIAVSTSRA